MRANAFGLFVVWLVVVGAGYVALSRYSLASGEMVTAPEVRPAAFPSSDSARSQLIVALHPKCPCSRATVNELARIISRTGDRADVEVLMYRPAAESDAWMEGAIMGACRRIHCRITPDPDGMIAASLGIRTSGGVVLYNATGQLEFQGGITASRGHEGDNNGKLAVIESLLGREPRTRAMPAFGCSIQ